MSGYVAMARDWQDHDLFEGDEFSRRDAWAWLIAQAAWKPTLVRVKGSKVELKRGELCFSQRFLASKWGWSKSRVERFLSLLCDEGMITARSKIGATTSHTADHPAGQGQRIITICNYDKYQASQTPQRGNNGPPSGTKSGQSRTTERTKEEEIKNSDTNVSGVPPVDPVKELFDLGVFLITGAGYADQQARSIIGRWRKAHGDDATLEALRDAKQLGISEPVEWVQARFTRQAGGLDQYLETLGRKYADAKPLSVPLEEEP